MMFVLGVIIGIVILGIAGFFVLIWVSEKAYELGRKDEREGRD